MIIVKKKTNFSDRQVLIKLADIYMAMRDIASNPVNKEGGLADSLALTERFNSDPKSVNIHFRILDDLSRLFDNITDWSNSSSRANICAEISVICERLRDYANLVSEHNEFWEGQGFLRFPSFGRGKVHYQEGGEQYTSNPFNPSNSYRGLVVEADEFGAEGLNFGFRTERIPLILFNAGFQSERDEETLAGKILGAKEYLTSLRLPLDVDL